MAVSEINAYSPAVRVLNLVPGISGIRSNTGNT
eukprot:SAG11_NODE_27011_length_338_cov_0.857741_1_plen_32_part_10